MFVIASEQVSTVRHAVEKLALRAALALPEGVQRRLAGDPVVIDGQTLSADTQLMLRLQQLTGLPGAETLPVPEGRTVVLQHAALAAGRQPIGATQDVVVGDLPARLYTPTEPTSAALLVFFHGGGFMYGDLDSHDASCRFLSERSGVRVLAVDYRLGPEHRFPVAYDDAVAAYREVVSEGGVAGFRPDRWAVGGDSAGANLAAGVAIVAAREGLPCDLQLLVYPVTDAEHRTTSFDLFGQGLYLTTEFMKLAGESYIAAGTDLRDPRLAPAYADLPPGLAPAYVATAGFDPLRDEGEDYARRLADAGVTVQLRRFDDQIHGFFNVVGVGRTARAANAEIAARVRAALS